MEVLSWSVNRFQVLQSDWAHFFLTGGNNSIIVGTARSQETTSTRKQMDSVQVRLLNY